MQDTSANTEARARVLDAAEHLFAQKGYTAVTLRDIAAKVGIKHASLYHHVPGGKEALFVEVTTRHLQRHQQGLTNVLREADQDIRSQLRAAAGWLLSQPPMDLVRMTYSDMPSVKVEHAQQLSMLAYDALLSPIERVLQQAYKRGEIGEHDFGLIAGGLVGMVESLYAVPQYVLSNNVEQGRHHMAYTLIDVFLDGLRAGS